MQHDFVLDAEHTRMKFPNICAFADGVTLKGVDECNPLVLPAKRAKRKQENKEVRASKKPLTKKQRKQLEKILEQKKKKAQVINVQY